MSEGDDFTEKTRRTLCNRVGGRCSRPWCDRPAVGPNSDPDKTTSIGVAAHITASRRGGPRYDERLTPAQRKSAKNGIWCCQVCAKLVDSDTSEYTAAELRAWKDVAEANHKLDQVSPGRRREDREEARWRNRFQRLDVELPGRRMLCLAWNGPFDDLVIVDEPRIVQPDDLRAINCALCRYQSAALRPFWVQIHGAPHHQVWEVDEYLKRRSLLKTPYARGPSDFLRVATDRRELCWFCPRCGSAKGGNYCVDCGGSVPIVGCP